MGDEMDIFNPEMLLENLMDDKEIAQMVLDGFLDDIPTQIQTLDDFLSKKEVEGVERQAHTIKGASANVGAGSLQALAFEMEKQGKAGDLEGVQNNMAALASEFGKARIQIEKTISQWQG